jgi:hypothetical protein
MADFHIDIATLREPRIGGFVIFDHLLTILSVYGISNLFNVDLYIVAIVLIILSIALHYIFNINTTTNHYLGLSQAPVIQKSSIA